MQKYRFTIVFSGQQIVINGTEVFSCNDFSPIEGRRLIVEDEGKQIANFPFIQTAVIEVVKWPIEDNYKSEDFRIRYVS